MVRVAYLGAAFCVLASALPASAATLLSWDFGRPSGTVNVASVAKTSSGVTLTATALRFTALPNTLTSLSQTSATGQIQQTVPGIGVKGGASDPQLDTNTPAAREGILITGSEDFSIRGLKLSYIDSDDTLQLYGVNADNSLVALGFGGIIKTGLAGAASASYSAANSGTVILSLLSPTTYYTRYLFTTRVGGETLYLGARGQGYQIDTINGAVPEPASWAMMIAGFGVVGVAARRRRTLMVAA